MRPRGNRYLPIGRVLIALTIVVLLPSLLVSNASASARSDCAKREFSMGDRGRCVKIIQRQLNKKLDAKIRARGRFGTITLEAIKQFQARESIAVTGKVDAQTWGALLRKDNVATSASEASTQSDSSSTVNTPLLSAPSTDVDPGTAPPSTTSSPPPATPETSQPPSASSPSPSQQPSSNKTVAIYRGGASCGGCSEDTANVLRNDSKYTWDIKFVGEGESQKLDTASLNGVDLYIQPGGGTIQADWPKLTSSGQEAIRQYTESGGNYLGICLGGFFIGQFGDIGWGWTTGVGTYQGPKYGTGAVVKTDWNGTTRNMWWGGGAQFATSGSGIEVLATYENDKGAAVLVPAGSGEAIGTGVHGEADESWYSNASLQADTDGIDPDLLLRMVHRLVDQ